MAAKKANLAVELAEKMLRALEARRDTDPLTLQTLAAQVDAQAHADLVLAAAGRKPFAEQAVVARKKDLAAPVALRDDLGRLADSPRLLQFALEATCTPAKRTHPAKRLAAKLVPELRGPFTEAVARRVRENSLPPFAGHRAEKGVVVLFLQSLPPLPPPRKPEVALAEALLHSLEERRRQGADHYPTTLRTLLGDVDAKLAKKALGQSAFKGGVVRALKTHPDTPLALASDAEALVGSPLLLEFLLRAARTEATNAFTAADLKKKLVPALRQPFADAVERGEGALPAEVGCVSLKGKKLLFFVGDMRRGASLSPLSPLPEGERGAVVFEPAFDAAFARLDRDRGGHNFVSLVDLRRAVPLPRTDFDAGLNRLRAAGRYTLSAAEGRHGLGDEERAAGLAEDGVLLLYVSRRSP